MVTTPDLYCAAYHKLNTKPVDFELEYFKENLQKTLYAVLHYSCLWGVGLGILTTYFQK